MGGADIGIREGTGNYMQKSGASTIQNIQKLLKQNGIPGSVRMNGSQVTITINDNTTTLNKLQSIFENFTVKSDPLSDGPHRNFSLTQNKENTQEFNKRIGNIVKNLPDGYTLKQNNDGLYTLTYMNQDGVSSFVAKVIERSDGLYVRPYSSSNTKPVPFEPATAANYIVNIGSEIQREQAEADHKNYGINTLRSVLKQMSSHGYSYIDDGDKYLVFKGETDTELGYLYMDNAFVYGEKQNTLMFQPAEGDAFPFGEGSFMVLDEISG